MAKYLGLDGFRKGWVVAWIDDEGRHGFEYASDLASLVSGAHSRAMIDIPIGLPDAGFRFCDLQARILLGPCVFPGARRGIWGFRSQKEANARYWSEEGQGRGISCQLWNIAKKMKEADDFVTPERQNVFCETHPELIFWSRSGRNRLPNKKSDEGRKRRIAILKSLGFELIEDMLSRRRGTGVGRDDLVDACACAIAARDAKNVIGNGERDIRGLRMEMCY